MESDIPDVPGIRRTILPRPATPPAAVHEGRSTTGSSCGQELFPSGVSATGTTEQSNSSASPSLQA
ncbi:hypothetical protein E1161_10070 [Saccharopolyspora aridisoli]|uniref:Uncharacterized protein n=1 Tax=Saccharopolyspora aridisoli TaxID=2530385 RepID=A0A4R4UPJ0_9PSEU|nr:hypothetical protein [Saccharopolyspora aridisoli]TDC93760.1 hypothetical protein E1161_10070 [Saccharopolyspora aridisoli]